MATLRRMRDSYEQEGTPEKVFTGKRVCIRANKSKEATQAMLTL